MQSLLFPTLLSDVEEWLAHLEPGFGIRDLPYTVGKKTKIQLSDGKVFVIDRSIPLPTGSVLDRASGDEAEDEGDAEDDESKAEDIENETRDADHSRDANDMEDDEAVERQEDLDDHDMDIYEEGIVYLFVPFTVSHCSF